MHGTNQYNVESIATSIYQYDKRKASSSCNVHNPSNNIQGDRKNRRLKIAITL